MFLLEHELSSKKSIHFHGLNLIIQTLRAGDSHSMKQSNGKFQQETSAQIYREFMSRLIYSEVYILKLPEIT